MIADEPAAAAATILVVDDDKQLRGIMRANLEIVGYHVVDAVDADGAIDALDHRRPDAIVVGTAPFPGDAAAVVRRIRTHPQGANVPLIALSPHGDAGDAVRSLDAGADDIVTKPFAPEEMLARIRGKIRRAAGGSQFQPLTGLPANGPIEAEMRRRLADAAPWSVLYADLDGFKAFNDAFGFGAGDDVITLLARTLTEQVERHGDGDDFVGHVGGDDFVAVMRPARADATAQAVCVAFDRAIRGLQRDTRVPYCSVSIAVVNASRGAATYEAIGERAALVKKEAKRRRGSAVVNEAEVVP